MSLKFTRPERTIRSEMLSLFSVLLVPIGIAIVFPYRAVGHSFTVSGKESRAFASLVFLTEEQEIEAIQRARSAWQTSDEKINGSEIDLLMERLPELDASVIMENPVVHSPARSISNSLNNVPLALPSLAAESPTKIEPSTIVGEKYFDDNDLMKLK